MKTSTTTTVVSEDDIILIQDNSPNMLYLFSFYSSGLYDSLKILVIYSTLLIFIIYKYGQNKLCYDSISSLKCL